MEQRKQTCWDKLDVFQLSAHMNGSETASGFPNPEVNPVANFGTTANTRFHSYICLILSSVIKFDD